MKMIGHKTRNIYRRYAIVDEAMLKEGAAKLQILHETRAPGALALYLTDAGHHAVRSEYRPRYLIAAAEARGDCAV